MPNAFYENKWVFVRAFFCLSAVPDSAETMTMTMTMCKIAFYVLLRYIIDLKATNIWVIFNC